MCSFGLGPHKKKPPEVMMAVQVTYERMEKVLHALEHDTDAPGRHLQDIAFAPMMRTPHFSQGAAPWVPVATRSLDASQRSAIALALASGDVALIHGPPGLCHSTIHYWFMPVSTACMFTQSFFKFQTAIYLLRCLQGQGKPRHLWR